MKRNGKKRKTNRGLIAVVVILGIIILLLAAVLAALTVFRSYFNRSNRVSDEDFTIYYELPAEAYEEYDQGEELSEGETEAEIDEAVIAEIQYQIESAVEQHEIQEQPYVYNLLLIGSDRQSDGWYGNSDSMVLVSVNTKVRKIFLTSFMRDLYANVPGFGADKLNSAYAHGAAPLLVQTIEQNFRIDIDNWASVDFNSMQAIVDTLGGIDMQISQDEANYINVDLPGEPVLGGGVMHLNGRQTVMFSRIRSIGGADYERTSRQRRVLEQLMQRIRGLGGAQAVSAILPYITHNLSEMEVIQRMASVPDWLTYQIIQDRIPYDGMYGHLGEQLVPDYNATIQRLHATVYATQ